MAKQTIWITGAAGRLGTELSDRLEKNSDYKILETDQDVDITDMHAVDHAMDMYRPTIVINCASISNAEYCEKHMVEAFKVNALGARNLASASRRINAKLIQLSTDDIFDGKTSGRLTEYDTPDPNTIYGKSKLAGENYVRELNPKHLIIRSSWVYSAAEGNYFSYVVEHGKRGESFEAPIDKISSPTSARTLAEFVERLIEESEYGTYHASCEGMCSRYEFAKTILSLMDYDVNLVKRKFTEGQSGQSSTLLENLMMKMTEIFTMPLWLDDLKDYIEDYKKQ
ncbi:MAG: NAD(P)-dependent oxidoreductase [Eubacteriales bacterium]|nr:NAD(P)-dependent oxidoreductase [Eubacteriales bacterium]